MGPLTLVLIAAIATGAIIVVAVLAGSLGPRFGIRPPAPPAVIVSIAMIISVVILVIALAGTPRTTAPTPPQARTDIAIQGNSMSLFGRGPQPTELAGETIGGFFELPAFQTGQHCGSAGTPILEPGEQYQNRLTEIAAELRAHNHPAVFKAVVYAGHDKRKLKSGNAALAMSRGKCICDALKPISCTYYPRGPLHFSNDPNDLAADRRPVVLIYTTRLILDRTPSQ